MKSTMKRALSLVLTALMLLMLLPGGMAEEMNTASAPVIPGLSDGGALVSEVLGESAEKTAAELYERLMAAETCQSIYDILGEESLENVEALSAEQLTDLIAYVETLEDDGTKEELIFDLTVLRDGDVENIPEPGGWRPGDDGGQGGGSNECDQSYYQSTAAVYWDTMTYNRSTKKGETYSAGRSLVTSVQLTSQNVKQADATSPRKASDGTEMSTYFSGASASKEVTSTLVITPKAGYYITDVVIACTGGNNESAFNCNTWSDGNAFTKDFNVGTSGSVSFTVSSKDFSHRSNSKKVFILIAVAPVPSPLYVEYWPGEIEKHVDSSVAIFSDSDAWTKQDTNNKLGTGEVQTNDTQFKYAYASGNSGAAANWKHCANSITDEAQNAAAKAGYYFTGWKVEYFTSCTATATNNDDRKYNYAFSSSYGNGEAQPSEEVHLVANCKLTAQWKPIELKVTKEVSGLNAIEDSGLNKNQTYTLTLQKQKTDGITYEDVQKVDYTINGDETLTKTFAASDADVTQAITPGTYKVVETVVEPIKGTNLNAYCTTTYPSETVVVRTDGTVEVGTDGTVKELKVLNEFSSKPATTEVTIKKFVEGNMGDWNKAFNFEATVTQNDEKVKIEYTQDQGYEVKKDGTITFSLQHYLENNPTRGSVTIKNIPIGATLTITEKDATDYTTTNSVDNGGKTATYTVKDASDQTITFTNIKTATPDTGVLLDSLPYLLILAVVVIVIVLSILRKRRNDD